MGYAITALKQIQGHIWDLGYQNGELKSQVYDDAPKFMERMQDSKVKVGIYSSGSREAQRSLFKYTNHGDLREYLSCSFDTKVGYKLEASSYILQEAEVAAMAGIDVALSVRSGNAPLLCKHPFHMINSFDEL